MGQTKVAAAHFFRGVCHLSPDPVSYLESSWYSLPTTYKESSARCNAAHKGHPLLASHLNMIPHVDCSKVSPDLCPYIHTACYLLDLSQDQLFLATSPYSPPLISSPFPAFYLPPVPQSTRTFFYRTSACGSVSTTLGIISASRCPTVTETAFGSRSKCLTL